AGDFVIGGWDGDGGFVQRYNAAGQLLGSAFPQPFWYINSVAMDARGDFVADWGEPSSDGSIIFVEEFNAAGQPLGGPLQVNRTPVHTATQATVAMDAAGDYAVTWSDANPDFNRQDIFAATFSSTRSGPIGGSVFQVNPDAT